MADVEGTGITELEGMDEADNVDAVAMGPEGNTCALETKGTVAATDELVPPV